MMSISCCVRCFNIAFSAASAENFSCANLTAASACLIDSVAFWWSSASPAKSASSSASAATPGARCRDCHGTGRAVDISKTELWGRVVEKECGRCKGVGYSRMPASAAYRAVTMLIPNLTQPTWSRTVKPLYDALVVQCHKEESIADNILNAVTR